MNEADRGRLSKAISVGDVKTVQRVVALADIKSDRKVLDLALYRTCFIGKAKSEIVDCLLKAGANPEQTTSIGTLLMLVAMGGDLALVKRLIEGGADPNREVKRETALTAALSENQTPIVEYLESIGANGPPTTRLLYAVMHGDLERARKAIADGADLERTGGTFEEKPLIAAARNGHFECVRLLLEHGVTPKKKTKDETALHAAARHGKNLQVVKALVEGGADIHARHHEKTVLMAAAEGGSLPIVKYLLERGAKVDERDKEVNMTALDHAKASKKKDVVAYLASLGATAGRDTGRSITRALARDFGGRPVEHSHGFALNAKVSGFKCQFYVLSDRCGVNVFGMKFVDAEFQELKDGEVIFSPVKPKSRHGAATKVNSANPGLCANVWKAGSTGSVSDQFLTKFCKRHQVQLSAVQLSGDESVSISSRAVCFRWCMTDFDTALPRIRCFERFIQDISRQPQPRRLLYEQEWLIKPAAKTASPRHFLGGKLDRPLGCPGCMGATNLMAHIDLADPSLPTTALGNFKLPVFWCLTCLEWSPVFYDMSGLEPKPLDAAGKPVAMERLNSGEPDLPGRSAVLAAVSTGKKAGRKSKLGGSPNWIQLEATPDCPRCQKNMAFVLQLASDSRISYDDMGILYAFICPGCRIAASLVQSH